MGQAVRLKYVEAQGFRSIRERQRVEFDDAGLVLFRGESGHGKSSFLLALAYALDYCLVPATALQCWEKDSPPLEVEVGLVSADGEVVVRRGASNYLKVGDSKPLKAAKAIKERLQQILGGLPPDLRRALTYRGQRQPGLFLSMTDGEKKDFLTQVLDLGKYEAQIAQSEKSVRACSEAHEAAAGKAKALTDLVGPRPLLELLDEAEMEDAVLGAKLAEEDARHKFSMAQCDVRDAKAREEAMAAESRKQFDCQKAAVQSEVDAIWATLTAFTPDTSEKSRLTFLQDSCVTRIREAEEGERQRRKLHDVESQFAYNRVTDSKKQLGALPGLIQKRNEKKAQLEYFTKNECPTCLRPWVAEAQAERVAAEVALLDSEIKALNALAEQVPTLEAHFRSFQFVPDPLLGQLQQAAGEIRRQLAVEEQKINSSKYLFQADIERRVAEAEARQNVIEVQAQRAYASIMNDPLRESKRLQAVVDELAVTHAGARDAIRSFSEEKSRRTSSNTIARIVYQKWVDQDACASAARTEEAQALAKYRAECDYLAMMKGFLGGIFAEILEEVSDESNKLLGGFPNTADCTIRFATEKENQDGSTKQSITALLTMRGHEADVRYHTSGGQLTSVELAVDMAVARVVSRRTGAYLGWLILDESFNGHTRSVKESCLEILQRHAQDNLVIIVDHATEFKEMFSRFVDVEMTNGRTTATCRRAA